MGGERQEVRSEMTGTWEGCRGSVEGTKRLCLQLFLLETKFEVVSAFKTQLTDMLSCWLHFGFFIENIVDKVLMRMV